MPPLHQEKSSLPVSQIDALLALRANGRLLLRRDRLALLEAVAKYGSITKAAGVLGFSYKAAWDAVQAINNVLPSPAFLTRFGGRGGGGAEVTDEGRKLISAFRRLEEKLARITSTLAAEGLENFDDLLVWGLAVKISARNCFRCSVVKIHSDMVDVTVQLQISSINDISAVVTHGAVEHLRLAPGRNVVALVKSSLITLAPPGEAPIVASRNRLEGRVTQRIDGTSNSEIQLAIGDGKILTAVVPIECTEDMAIAPGDRLDAFFRGSHVILAAD
jgi:molybdate transport system regulatory protein